METKDFILSHNEKMTLLYIARQTIICSLEKQKKYNVEKNLLTDNLKTKTGCFVSLHKDRLLRGCIGTFNASGELYEQVQNMAIAAATRDYRFQTVKPHEMEDIKIEISVLTPLKRITSKDEFILGKHGIYIVKGNLNGTYLPQVAEQLNLSKEEYIQHCALHKAGIDKDKWNTAELYTYEAIIFEE